MCGGRLKAFILTIVLCLSSQSTTTTLSPAGTSERGGGRGEEDGRETKGEKSCIKGTRISINTKSSPKEQRGTPYRSIGGVVGTQQVPELVLKGVVSSKKS